MASNLAEPSVPPRLPFQVLDPSLQAFFASPPVFLARHFAHNNSSSSPSRPPAPTFLATSAVVFDSPILSPRTDGAPPRVLLVQRAAHDSMPLSWETPGGGCDDDDASMLHSCARELREEAGLEAMSFGLLVRCLAGDANAATAEGGPDDGEPEWGERMGGQFFFTRKGKLISKFYFVVEAKQTSNVVVDPNEHAAYLWATEEEVKDERMHDEEGKEGKGLKFTTAEQRLVLLEAFKLRDKRA